MERGRKGGAEQGREGRGNSVPLGTERDSFALNLGNRQHIMCLHTPTYEESLSLYCGAQKDNGRFNMRPVNSQVSRKSVFKRLNEC